VLPHRSRLTFQYVVSIAAVAFETSGPSDFRRRDESEATRALKARRQRSEDQPRDDSPMMMQVISQHYRPHLAQMMTATAVMVSPAIKPMSGAMRSHLCRLRV
jgi:hypothetical protein